MSKSDFKKACNKIGPGGLKCFCCDPWRAGNGKAGNRKAAKRMFNRWLRRTSKVDGNPSLDSSARSWSTT